MLYVVFKMHIAQQGKILINLLHSKLALIVLSQQETNK